MQSEDGIGGLRKFLYRALARELERSGRALERIDDSERLADLGIDSMGLLRLYLELQEFPGADLTRIAEDGAPDRVRDLLALGAKATASNGSRPDGR